MATAGERYSERTGNIWSYAYRQDMTGLRAAIQRGVDVNMINTVGWTPAIAAAAGGRNKALRYLVKQGADLSIADKGGSMASHHAAKNGHAHALKVLQELGCDITKVRLSQAKGKEVRDVLIQAYKKAGRNIKEGEDDFDSDEEEKIVGYNRKQAKSTAFWGPRRTPISAKIKKKIIKNKRIKKKDRLQVDDGCLDDELESAIGHQCLVNTTTANEANQESHDEESLNVEAKNELSYKETVQMIKRNQSKKQKRRQQRKAKREEEAAMEGNSNQSTIQYNDDGHEATSMESDDEDNDSIEKPLVSSFAAFTNIDSDSDSSCECHSE